LNTVSLSVSASLTQVLRWVYWWNSTELIPDAIGPDLVLASLNTDFSITGMSFQEITALVAAWQAGAISQATMLDLFRAGEVIAPGRTNEDEIKLLKTEGGNATPVLVKPPVSKAITDNPQPLT
jgi:membrane-associated HD superfamily phosphohydrolase